MVPAIADTRNSPRQRILAIGEQAHRIARAQPIRRVGWAEPVAGHGPGAQAQSSDNRSSDRRSARTGHTSFWGKQRTPVFGTPIMRAGC